MKWLDLFTESRGFTAMEGYLNKGFLQWERVFDTAH